MDERRDGPRWLCDDDDDDDEWIANSSGIGLASILFFGVRRSSTSSNPYCVGSRRSCRWTRGIPSRLWRKLL